MEAATPSEKAAVQKAGAQKTTARTASAPTATTGTPRPTGRDFALVLSGQAVSMQGDGLSSLALLWWIADETGSVPVATLLAMLSMLPSIVLGPFAGVFVDRYSRRTLMMVADVVRAVGAGVLAWGMLTGRLNMGLLLAVATVAGACRAFHRPALQASIVQLVPPQGLNRANSLFMTAEAGSNLLAPALGGVLVAWMGAGNVMIITAATCVIAAVTLLLAYIPPLSGAAAPTASTVGESRPAQDAPASSAPSASGAGASGQGKGGMLRDVAAGLSYLWNGQRMLFFMLCTFALVNFAIVPVGPLLPFIAQQRMGVDATGTGILMSGISAGMVAGAVVMSVIGARVRRGIGVIWGITAVGLCLAAASQMKAVPPAFAAFALVGVGVSLVNVCSNGLFQTLVPQEMQGRVFAVRGTIAQAATPLSLALVGVASATIAPHTLLLVGGVLVTIGGLLGYAVPGLARAE